MLRPGAARWLACIVLAVPACAEPPSVAPDAAGSVAVAIEAETPASATVWVALGGETFTLELAADPETRYRGLSGRTSISRNAGMLFVYRRRAPRAMVMRDCHVPIDVAFLDGDGRVVAVAEMPVEPPRAAGESRAAYESRLPVYRSGAPAQLAIEVAGGRLRQLGVSVGSFVALDVASLAAAAR